MQIFLQKKCRLMLYLQQKLVNQQPDPIMSDSFKPVSPTSFRIDKYLVNDICGFNEQIDSDDRLVRNVVYSVAEDYEHSLFGFGSIDPARFAERWQYDPSFLRRRVTEPYQLRDMTADEILRYRERISSRIGGIKDAGSDRYVWDTRLENALYILSNKPFNFNSYGEFVATGKNGPQERIIKSHASFTLFSSIDTVNRGRNKVVYTYTLNENFEKNLTRYYIRGERESLLRLRSCGLDSLYLYLTNLRINLALEGKGVAAGTAAAGFDHLCNLAGIPSKTQSGGDYEPRERKKLLVRALRRVVETTELKFEVRWGRAADGSSPYLPEIDFGTEHLGMYDARRPGPGRIVVQTERNLIQRQLIQREMLAMYKKLFSGGRYLPVDENMFNAWATDVNQNREEKVTALRLAYIGIFGMIPKNEVSLNKAVFDALDKGRGTSLPKALSGIKLEA